MEKRRAYNRAYYQATRQKRNVQHRASYQANRQKELRRSAAYKLTHQAEQRKYRQKHPDDWRKRHESLFADAMKFLGDKCACPGCGISEPAFLTIDHIIGRPRGTKAYGPRDAKRAGWDKSLFQVLCANCNFAKRDRGFCPVHQIKDCFQSELGKGNGQFTLALG